eukprot:5792410-Prymnesium_polylepis.1
MRNSCTVTKYPERAARVVRSQLLDIQGRYVAAAAAARSAGRLWEPLAPTRVHTRSPRTAQRNRPPEAPEEGLSPSARGGRRS